MQSNISRETERKYRTESTHFELPVQAQIYIKNRKSICIRRNESINITVKWNKPMY